MILQEAIITIYNDINCEEYDYETSNLFPVPPNNLPKTACEFTAETSSEVQNVKEISSDIKQKINVLQNKFNFNIFNKFNKDDK